MFGDYTHYIQSESTEWYWYRQVDTGVARYLSEWQLDATPGPACFQVLMGRIKRFESQA